MYTFHEVRNKIFAYEYSIKHNTPEQSTRIIAELEVENFHKVVRCLLEQDYDGHIRR